jgi:hypothetical protein
LPPSLLFPTRRSSAPLLLVLFLIRLSPQIAFPLLLPRSKAIEHFLNSKFPSNLGRLVTSRICRPQPSNYKLCSTKRKYRSLYFLFRYPSTSACVKTEPLCSPRKNSINILRRRRISQKVQNSYLRSFNLFLKNNISKPQPQIVKGYSILGTSPSKSRRKQIL